MRNDKSDKDIDEMDLDEIDELEDEDEEWELYELAESLLCRRYDGPKNKPTRPIIHCPACLRTVKIGIPKCRCGQKIDWSEYDREREDNRRGSRGVH